MWILIFLLPCQRRTCLRIETSSTVSSPGATASWRLRSRVSSVSEDLARKIVLVIVGAPSEKKAMDPKLETVSQALHGIPPACPEGLDVPVFSSWASPESPVLLPEPRP